MKKIFTLLLSSLFSLSLLAFDGSRLSIATVGNDKFEFHVEVDGRRYEMKDHTVTISNLSQGNHNVRIFRVKKNRNGFNRKQELIYATTIFLRRGFHFDITMNRFGKALVDERVIENNEDVFDDGYDDDYYDDDFAEIMDAREFQQVKEAIGKEWLESNKLNSVKFIIDKNLFSTMQVRELMSLFSFEKNKLEVAKYAYRRTVDKHNYYQVNDQLVFSSSKEELARFLRESR